MVANYCHSNQSLLLIRGRDAGRSLVSLQGASLNGFTDKLTAQLLMYVEASRVHIRKLTTGKDELHACQSNSALGNGKFLS